MILGSLAVQALLPGGGPGAASRDRADAAAPASFDRRKMLSVFAASVFPASVCEASAALAPATYEAPPATSTLPAKQTTDWTRADFDWDSVGRPAPPPALPPSPAAVVTAQLAEAFEEVYTPQSGLAKLALTVEQASQLVERLELVEKLEQLQNLEQLQLLLRSPFMVSFLGYEPYEVVEVEPVTVKTSRTKSGPPVDEQQGDPRILETQLTFLNSFPESNRRQAAEGLSGFFSQVRTLDRACHATMSAKDVNVEDLRKCAEEARRDVQEITKLYYAAGCMVCSQDVRSVIASDATWSNPNLAVLDQFEPRLNRRPERTAQEEKAALRMGFRPD